MSWLDIVHVRRFPNDTSSDMSAYDFLVQPGIDLAARRVRMQLVVLQTRATGMAGWIFTYLALRAIKAFWRQPHNPIAWCVLVQSTNGVILCLIMNSTYVL